MFDLNKPVQTNKPTDWVDVEIIKTDLKGKYSIIAVVTHTNGDQSVETFTSNGKYLEGNEDSGYDLINVPEKHVRYINFSVLSGEVYLDGMFEDSITALENRSVNTCARVRVEFQEGKFDE